MYAIVDIAGQQFKVTKDQKLFVHRLEGETGSKISFDKVRSCFASLKLHANSLF